MSIAKREEKLKRDRDRIALKRAIKAGFSTVAAHRADTDARRKSGIAATAAKWELADKIVAESAASTAAVYEDMTRRAELEQTNKEQRAAIGVKTEPPKYEDSGEWLRNHMHDKTNVIYTPPATHHYGMRVGRMDESVVKRFNADNAPLDEDLAAERVQQLMRDTARELGAHEQSARPMSYRRHVCIVMGCDEDST
jgi:hypothetical protein